MEEAEHREVKGISQGHRVSRFWNQDPNSDGSAMVFTTNSGDQIIYFLYFLYSRHLLFSSSSVSQRFLPASVLLFMFSLPAEFFPAGTFSSFPSEPKSHVLRKPPLNSL